MTTTIRSTMKSSMKRTVTGTVGFVFISLLVVGIATTGNQAGVTRTAQAQEETQSAARQSPSSRRFHCSNATLRGRYATKGEGFVPSGPPPAPMVPFAVVSLMTLDGFGNLSNASTASTNGVIESGIRTGTYTVNDDCTGKLTVIIPFPPFQLTHDLVVADKGNEFYLIATTPSVVTIAGKRLQ